MDFLFQKTNYGKSAGARDYSNFYIFLKRCDFVSLDAGGSSGCFWNRPHFCDISEQ